MTTIELSYRDLFMFGYMFVYTNIVNFFLDSIIGLYDFVHSLFTTKTENFTLINFRTNNKNYKIIHNNITKNSVLCAKLNSKTQDIDITEFFSQIAGPNENFFGQNLTPRDIADLGNFDLVSPICLSIMDTDINMHTFDEFDVIKLESISDSEIVN